MDRALLTAFGRRIRVGIIGGGTDSVIGAVHFAAMRADGMYDLVAGAMSINPEIAKSSAEQQLVPPDRIYTDWRVMLQAELARPDCIDVVVVATPPRLHKEMTITCMKHGIDVICEKPISHTLEEARDINEIVKNEGRLFCLNYCYSGYPMVREARNLVRNGHIGKVRLIDMEFSVGNELSAFEPDDLAKRHWRFRVDQAGKGGLLGEAGSHAYHMASFVTGLTAESVSALMSTYAARREVYDNAYITVRYPGGVAGRFWYSYVAAGHDHGLTMRIYGEKAGLTWWQEDGEVLWHKPFGRPAERIARGYRDILSDDANNATRIGMGHPEGYIMAFANIYKDFAMAFIARKLGKPPQAYLRLLPEADAGVEGMAMIEACIASDGAGGAWVDVSRLP